MTRHVLHNCLAKYLRDILGCRNELRFGSLFIVYFWQ